jgi:hypothetical protein
MAGLFYCGDHRPIPATLCPHHSADALGFRGAIVSGPSFAFAALALARRIHLTGNIRCSYGVPGHIT